jgi:hypothetical protein
MDAVVSVLGILALCYAFGAAITAIVYGLIAREAARQSDPASEREER